MINISINPIVFSLGPLTVRWYGLMIDLAVITLVLWALRAVKNDPRLNYDMVLNAAMVAVPSGIVFSKLIHIVDQWSYYSQRPFVQLLSGEGMTIWGAVLGATIGLWVYSRLGKFSFGHLADVIAPGIILAQAIGRVGCLINGCCYGNATSLPWGILYTNRASYGFVASFQLPLGLGLGLHPVQAYEIIYNLVVFGFLYALRNRFKPDGSLFLIYLTFYGVWRLFIDFLRPGTPFLLGLHQAQVISIIVLLVTIPLLVFRTRRIKTEEEPAEAPVEIAEEAKKQEL
jgi:phosphatidylglycerol:prolipoprotein diacylglycerol transferase